MAPCFWGPTTGARHISGSLSGCGLQAYSLVTSLMKDQTANGKTRCSD
jgi:hypothetical protein